MQHNYDGEHGGCEYGCHAQVANHVVVVFRRDRIGLANLAHFFGASDASFLLACRMGALWRSGWPCGGAGAGGGARSRRRAGAL